MRVSLARLIGGAIAMGPVFLGTSWTASDLKSEVM